MSNIRLEMKSVDFKQLKKHNLKAQYFPVSIDENILVKTRDYFKPYTRTENGVLKNSLRGRPLDGCRMQLPDKYQAIVWQEPKVVLDHDGSKRTFKPKGIFTEFTYWNYDKEPSDNDALKQALVWNDLANVLHQPITADEFENGITINGTAAEVKTEEA